MISFQPTREAGLRRLAEFVPGAARYGVERNFVRDGHENVSRLSPWLQRRLVLESEVVEATLASHALGDVEKFVQEVFWRTYWKGWLEARPAAWTRWIEAVPRLREGLGAGERARVEAAMAGRTDIECFNAWANELTTTGYLHNHARMWFASIWVFTLRLPWELGAAFFHEHLLDGDAAANTLSWRWVAGLHTPGKTYLARADNIARYTEGRFSPRAGQLASEAVALTEPPLPLRAAGRLGPPEGDDDRCAPAAEDAPGGRCGWWLHGEDLAIETGESARESVGSIFAMWPAEIARDAGWSEAVAEFSRAALADGARRASDHFQAAVTAPQTGDFAAAMTAWALGKRLSSVRAYRPAVGPWAPVAEVTEQALARAGVRVIWLRRRWDEAGFPHATRGFFPFWEWARTHALAAG